MEMNRFETSLGHTIRKGSNAGGIPVALRVGTPRKQDLKDLSTKLILSTALLAAFLAPPLAAQTRDSVWTIRGGRFAGSRIPISVYLAKRSKFIRQSKLGNDPGFVMWMPSRLPAAVAFRPGKVNLEDSAAFWSILRDMESDMGMRLFEPATLTPGADPGDVIIVDTKNMSGDDGLTYVTWGENGGLYDARVYLRSRMTLHDWRIVTHEMMHALGFGHTSAWSSVMNSGPYAPRRLTPDDVAYAQFAFESRVESDRNDMWQRLAMAVERERSSASPEAGYEDCSSDLPTPADGYRTSKLLRLTPLAVFTVVAACGLPLATPFR